ncbi:cytochrome C oxidase subunit I [Niastella vici]|uniref:Cytochrome C oxidase subunit I n=1 Tax=Niastella vici TaxID=1703345 RepID=A0A1V9G061_9BACT|nr:cytochrome C oxidase subunit I [Niastella vici]OQP64009.1 cytochrome C oxidase subunit I [Niastella vici]
MLTGNNHNELVKTTTHKVVVPFYIYAALAFLVAAWLLFTSSHTFSQYYFQPQLLAITHTMALGWGTMIILGSSHQLLPILVERELYSNTLAHFTFAFAAVGIPMLVWSFYTFNMLWPAQSGALLINIAVLLYLINVTASILKSQHENIHAVFVLTSGIWLFITTLIGGLLVFNFTYNLLPKDSLHYLSLHAHLGITGWFLLLVIGVGTKLIPLFLISQYSNTSLLKWIFALINAGLLAFVFIFLFIQLPFLFLIPVALITIALVLFGYYCFKAYQLRIRKQPDGQMKVSLLSAAMMAVPLLFLLIIITMLLNSPVNTHVVLTYGFTIFFGWLTAIILGMTFKTLPFIIWNKKYHAKAGLGQTPNPKDLFSDKVFNGMAISYLFGFCCFAGGILTADAMVLKTGAASLLCCAFLYNTNVLKILFHKENLS